ncbi:MAG: lamin tail domain-containing protein, partial [Verrucomicrobiota bacterium]
MKLKCCLWLKPIVLLFLISGSVFAQSDPQITEFMASNRAALADEDGDFPDWIEIYNPSTTAINLDGWYLTDSDNQLNKWRFPAVTVPSKNFLIVFASGKNRAIAGAELHTSFTLRAEGEYLALVKPDGVTIASQFSPGYPEQFEDISYGIGQNVQTNVLVTAGASARILVPSSGALGVSWTAPGFSDSTWLVGKTGIGYETAVPGFAVRNFKANITVSSLTDAESVITNPARQSSVAGENSNVINYYGSGGDGHYGDNAPFPGAVVGADIDDFVIEATATITIPTAGEWTFGVNSDDGFSLTIGSFTMSYPNPRGPADTLDVFNFPAAGEYNLRLVFYERGGGSCVELFAARGNVPGWNSTNFRLVGDTANGGLAVQAPVISGNSASSYRPLIATDLQSQMKGRNASAYLRIPFVVANAGSLESLLLRVKYDDGFVAYLNGQEVARRNAPTAPSWNATATASHPNTEAMVFEEINISDKLGAILTGSNVLAIHGLNQSNNDTDFLILPELVEKKVQPASLHYFSTATPGAFNGSGFFAFVEDTKFSHDRGFYDAPFDLTITTATTNAVIRYTTNGLLPTATTGFVYSGPIRISGTTVLRAAAFREGFEPSNVDTQTYLFLEDVIRQSPTGQAPPGWPSSWGANVVDYGMDPDVVNNPLYSGTIKSDLKSIPTFSIVMNLDDLFNSQTGIYANPGQEGRSAERSASVELIHPDGVDGFQIDAGIRIRGGFSRSTGNPKHAFRLFFRQEYGAPKLRYPLFGDAGTDTFDAFDLRTFQNYSWSFQGDSRGVFIRDQFSRDAQLAMGQQGERGNYYHLYINGQYWGLFNTCERPEASYGETYFGGQKENFDVIKVEAGPYSLNATDGDMAAWTRLYNLVKAGVSTDEAYYKIQGRNADGSPNPAYENLLDVENLIDYMLVILYGGNLDAPISNFLQNQRPNNWYGMRDRTGASGGFKFFAHDAEHTLLNVNEDRTGPYPAGDSSVIYSSPQWIWQKLQANAEFRLKVADHVHRHLFNNGVLTPQGARALFMARKDQIDRAVVGESARWGDAKTASPLTRSHWLSAVGSITNGFLPQRTGVLLNQLRADNLYPAVAAPTFSQHGGNVNKGYNLSISAPAGTVYYTLDGSDPRRLGGAVSGAAQIYRTPLAVNESVQINARVLSGGVWSALNQATFTVIQTFTNLLITEIMYNPAPAAGIDGDEYEFIELKNTSNEVLDLSGVHFSNGFSFTFPLGTRASPGQFIVLASNPIEFAKRYPTVRIDGTYTGRLANGGERIQLAHAIGTPIFNVSYSDEAPWPQAADGNGFSIVPVNPNLNPDPANPVHWRASAAIGGSPGRDDISANTGIVWINEVLTHTDPPQIDAIELFNPTTSTVDISHWYLTDSRLNPKKYRIPATTRLGPGEFKVFTEVDFNPTPGVDPSFTLSSHGEEVYIFSANQAGDLTGFSDGFSFGAAANGVSFGRYSTAGGDVQYPAQRALTLG